MSKQTKITKSAKWEKCTVRQPFICNNDESTVVYAHLNGAGMGRKSDDPFGAYACSSCHSWLDGRYVKTHTRDQRDLAHLQAMKETQAILFKKGLLVVT